MDRIDLGALYGNHLGRECHLPQQTSKWMYFRELC